jgi:hypothetical protein
MVSEHATNEGDSKPADNQGTPPAAHEQPRWMTITVALTGIIGLVVMVLLVRG